MRAALSANFTKMRHASYLILTIFRYPGWIGGFGIERESTSALLAFLTNKRNTGSTNLGAAIGQDKSDMTCPYLQERGTESAQMELCDGRS